MIVLDTDVCISILNGYVTANDIFKDKDERLYLTSPTIFELYQGLYMHHKGKKAYSSQRFKNENDTLDLFVNSFNQLHYNSKAAKISAEIYSHLKSEGKSIGAFDCMIAGCILSHGLKKIITYNVKHFDLISELEVYSPMMD